MAGDQYKFSIEARPLKAIYSKYKDSEVNVPIQVMRPLGCIRKVNKSSAEKKRSTTKNKERRLPDKFGVDNYVTVSNWDSLKREYTKTEKKSMYKSLDVDRTKSRHEYNISEIGNNKDTNNNSLKEFDVNTLPCLNRSKSQLFEHRFKLAAARPNGQEAISPTCKRTKDVKKRVIHLPLFRVNLKTYQNESEVIRTVAKTRESLRQLMELHRSKMKTPNMVAANIKHYEFHAPSSPRFNTFRSDQNLKGMAMSKPFPAKRAKKSLKSRDQRDSYCVKQLMNDCKIGMGNGELKQTDSSKSTSNRINVDKTPSALKYQEPLEPCLDEQSEETFLTDVIRPETALTLASTMSHMDRVLKSPGSDELREISEVFTITETQPVWPSFDDYQRLNTLSHISKARTTSSFTRAKTVINYQKDLLPSVSTNPHTMRNGCNSSLETGNGIRLQRHVNSYKPVLRYTSKQATFKLDPIVVPSHTCTECPMCNVFEGDSETYCPPNSPMSSQFHLNTDLIGIEPRTSSNRIIRNGLHMINMNGTTTDDISVCNPMKASY